MRKILILLLPLMMCLQAVGQEVNKENSKEGVRSHFMGELGLNSGVSYEQRLGRNFSIVGRVGYDTMLWATLPDGIVFQGIFPAVRLSTRWYYSGGKIDGDINKGGYISIDMGYTHGRHGGIFTGHWNNTPYDGTVNLIQPSWGYNWQIGERLGIKFQVGLTLGSILEGYIWLLDRYRYETRGWNAVVMDFGLMYTF